MRSALFAGASVAVALLVSASCNKVIETGYMTKGLFELTPDDFGRHQNWKLGTKLESPGAAPSSDDGWQPTGVRFDKGTLMLIEASGTITADSGTGDSITVNPEGRYGWLSGYPYLLVGRTPYALFGRIGKSVFRIGKAAALYAPASGELELAANRCQDCTVEGSFDVSLHIELADNVKLAQEPKLSDNTVTDTTDLKVVPHQGWVDSSWVVKRGEKLFIDAQGTISAQGVRSDSESCSANGLEGWLGGTNYLIPSSTAYALFAKVGDSIVELGTSAAFLAPASGPLQLAINSDPDNQVSGELQVTVSRGIRPARGLQSIDPADLLNQDSVTIPGGDDQWHATNVTVERGEPIVFAAAGELSGERIEQLGYHSNVGPDGHGTHGGTIFSVPSRPAWALFARVKDQVFFVGSSRVVLAPADGPVELATNAIKCSDCLDCSHCQLPSCDPYEECCDSFACIPCEKWCGPVSGEYVASVRAH